jgi:hypothetical protein
MAREFAARYGAYSETFIKAIAAPVDMVPRLCQIRFVRIGPSGNAVDEIRLLSFFFFGF